MPRDWSFPLLALLVLLPPLGLLPGCDSNDSGMDNGIDELRLTLSPPETAVEGHPTEASGSAVVYTTRNTQLAPKKIKGFYNGESVETVRNQREITIPGNTPTPPTDTVRMRATATVGDDTQTKEKQIVFDVEDPDTTPPTATFSVDPQQGQEPLNVTLELTGTDEESGVATYKIDGNNDGDYTGTFATERDTITDQPINNLTFTADTSRTLAAAVEDAAGNLSDIIEKELNVQQDNTPPNIDANAQEPDNNYGHITLEGDTDEPATIQAYLLNPEGTDSTKALSIDNAQMFSKSIEANQLGNSIGDTATLTIQATDQAGNTTTQLAQATIDGTDVDVTTLESNSEPDIDNQPAQAYVSGPDTTIQSTTQGEATLENLTPGDTVHVNDDQQDGTIGDFYQANIPLTTKQDTSLQALMLENINLAEGDMFYDNSLELILDATDGYMRMVPNNFKPGWNQSTDEFFPVTYAINKNGNNLPDDHKEKLKQGIQSWNGPNGNYNNANIAEDTTTADITIRIADETGYKRKQRVVEIDEPAQSDKPEETGKLAAHEWFHVTELGSFVSGHLGSPEYAGSTTTQQKDLGASLPEVKALDLMKDARQELDSGRNIALYWEDE